MKKTLTFLFIICCFSAKSQINTNPENNNSKTQETKSQYKPKGSGNKGFKIERLMVGGGIGLGLGNAYTSFSIAPEVGYFVWPERILIGGRFIYNYYRDKTVLINGSFPKLNIYGGGPFARGYIYKGLFAQLEYEYTYLKRFPYLGGISGNQVFYKDLLFNGFLVGAGFHQNFESGPGFYIQILYNVLQSTELISPNPTFRTGFTYTFQSR